MLRILPLITLVFLSLHSEELKVSADLFESDEQKGITLFTGNVAIIKGNDTLDANSVEIHTDANRKPTKFIAVGSVNFSIHANNNAYKGSSKKAIFMPQIKEYHFYGDVSLMQLGSHNTIKGEKVIVNLTKGTATAQGDSKKPVSMTFQIDNSDEKND
ncbi:MAG: lipopolysaccharide transport periplasmic protein LptA [Campylobacterota bacterium]|nr:lipopolysaccharide transport periplasmic protein LptA [Campylobacterota bacterium]